MAKEVKTSNLTLRKSLMFLTAHNSCLWARSGWTPLFKKLRLNINSAGKFTLQQWPHEDLPLPDCLQRPINQTPNLKKHWCCKGGNTTCVHVQHLWFFFSCCSYQGISQSLSKGCKELWHVGELMWLWREGGGVRWHSIGGLSPEHTRESRSSHASGWAGTLALHFWGEGDRCCLQAVADLLTALTAPSFTHPTPKPAVTILLYWV